MDSSQPPNVTSASQSAAANATAAASTENNANPNNRRSRRPPRGESSAGDGNAAAADQNATANDDRRRRRGGGGGRGVPADQGAEENTATSRRGNTSRRGKDGESANAPAAEGEGRRRGGRNNNDKDTTTADASTAVEGSRNNNGGRRGGGGLNANAEPFRGASASAAAAEGQNNRRPAFPSTNGRDGGGNRRGGALNADAAPFHLPNNRASTTTTPASGGGNGNSRNSNNNRLSHMSRTSASAASEASSEPSDNTPFVTSEQAQQIVGTVDGSAATKQICTELLTGDYECVLCLVPIRARVATWSCASCYHVFHLSCVKHWAKQPDSGSGKTFRCPHCQAPDNTAAAYYCFCSKQRDPKYDPNIVPHGCGDSCGKKRGYGCNHPCPAMCHPGPCPPCPRFHTAKCPCGSTTYDYGCDKPDPKLTCEHTCGKLLGCGNHRCTRPCHNGPCGKCDKTQETPCVCGKEVKQLPCGASAFSCNQPCLKRQRCGEHQCPVTCHSGNCPPCDYDPAMVSSCPCGKEELTVTRTKCTDPIPTCENLCCKALLCGNHICEEKCHDGPCKPCTVRMLYKCRCGQVQAKVLCAEREQFRCEKKCKTPLKCGRHECPELCCSHRGKLHPNGNECPRVCGKQLLCGHTCPDRCHPGLCQPCPNVITSVLQCRCGNQQRIPPLPCGTLPPKCFLPCTLPRPCGHPQTKHDCHYDECPPCMHLTKKMCDGGHKEVEVFCHTTKVSCGAKCGRPLPCGHSCDRLCHDGPCRADVNEVCKRPCGKEIKECGHFCGVACHSNKPNVVCKCMSKVSIQCECGRKTEEVGCAKYQKLLNARLEAKAAAEATQAGSEASASAATAAQTDFDRPLTVDCDSDCAYQNRLSALAARSAPKVEAQHKSTIYSLRLWDIAGSQLDVVGKIETKLNEFIRNGSELSLMLPPMPKDRRVIVHELANFYSLKCESVDQEPNRTCYLTKTMKSRIPNPQLTAARINSVHHTTSDPNAIIANVITSTTLAPAQTLIFVGDKNLNEIAINTYLKEIIGSFVAVQSEDAYNMIPNTKKMFEPLFDAMDEFVYFAVFATKFDTDAGFALLRKSGCPVLYQRVGEAPPPAKHNWEPRRDPNGAIVDEEEAQPTAAASKPKSWGEMFSQPRLNAKQRKEIENNKVELTGGAFASLAKRK